MSMELILKHLPQRYPFLMCDRIEDFKYRQYSRGYKNITINEPCFQNSLPGELEFPGILILEAMTQIGGFIFLKESVHAEKELKGVIIGFNKVNFMRKPLPGDKLDVYAEFINQFGPIGKVGVKASVKGKVVAEAEIMYKFERD